MPRLNEKQRNLIYYQVPRCALSYATEQAIYDTMWDEKLHPDDGRELVGYVEALANMRSAESRGTYEEKYAPKDMENAMRDLLDLLDRHKKSKKQ